MTTGIRWTESFFHAHPVFRTEQFVDAAPSTRATAHALLRQHRRTGRIASVRRGIWFAPSSRFTPEAPDPFAVAAAVAPDAVVGLHAALRLHGYGHSQLSTLTYYASTRPATFDCSGMQLRAVAHPAALVTLDAVDLETEQVERAGTRVTVTSLERTVVDMLDRQDLSGGIEEVWRSATQLSWLDERRVLRYVHARNSATLAARTGFLLEQLASLNVPPSALHELQALAQTLSPGPFEFAPDERGPRRYVHAWRLRVPESVIERRWSEPGTW